jgi:hypothetical protein
MKRKSNIYQKRKDADEKHITVYAVQKRAHEIKCPPRTVKVPEATTAGHMKSEGLQLRSFSYTRTVNM